MLYLLVLLDHWILLCIMPSYLLNSFTMTYAIMPVIHLLRIILISTGNLYSARLKTHLVDEFFLCFDKHILIWKFLHVVIYYFSLILLFVPRHSICSKSLARTASRSSNHSLYFYCLLCYSFCNHHASFIKIFLNLSSSSHIICTDHLLSLFKIFFGTIFA